MNEEISRRRILKVGVVAVPVILGIIAGTGLAKYISDYMHRQNEVAVARQLSQPKLEMVVDAEEIRVGVPATIAGVEEVEPNHKRRISQEGLDLIKHAEGFSGKSYRCPAGKRTIGYGHLIKEGESYKSLTRENAEQLLKKDVNIAEDAINRYVKVPLTQSQYDALCSFVYNVGEGNFEESTLLRKLNSEDYKSASREFGKWVYADKKKSKGLESRRKREKFFFENKNEK